MDENSKPAATSRLRQERLLRGWSQQELADRLGTTVVTVSRWERGAQYPGPMMRLRLCMLFEKTERELGLLPEDSESVSVPSPPKSQDDAVVAPEIVLGADETPEVTALSSTQEVGNALSYTETEEQTSKRMLLAHPSPLTHPRPGFLPFHIFTRWTMALPILLLLILMTSLLLGFDRTHTPHSKLRGIPTPSAGTTQPVPAPYDASGHLVFDNALRNEQTGSAWLLSDPHQVRGCHFLNGAYDIRDVETNYCLATNTDFANFVYQIEMTTIQAQPGQAGRILFRADDAKDAYYDFQVGVDGSYYLSRSDATGDTVLTEGHSSAIIQRDLQPNLLAVKASGKDLYLYVNFHLVAHVQDLSYTHGSIGIGVVVNTGTQEIKVAFRDAKVWAL